MLPGRKCWAVNLVFIKKIRSPRLPKIPTPFKIAPLWLWMSILPYRPAPRHACNENRSSTWLPLTSQWSLTVTHSLQLLVKKITFFALFSSHICSSKTSLLEPRRARAKTLHLCLLIILASSCCLCGSTLGVTWLFLSLSFHPEVRSCRAEPLGLIDLDRNHCCR